jgi:hypothetical protein
MHLAAFRMRRAALHALALLLLSFIAVRLATKPILAGDGIEYFSMLESFWNHGSPDQRLADMESLHRVLDSHAAIIARPHDGFFVSLDGRWYSFHFWLYPLLAVPAKAVLRLLRADEFGALAWTNAWIVIGTTAWTLHGKRDLSRVAFLALALLGPLLWYVRWPHAEVFAWACVVTSLVSLDDRRYVRAAALAGLGALQAPPIALLALLVAVFAALDRKPRRALRITTSLAAGATALGAPIFFFLSFGSPNLIATSGGADAALISYRRVWSLAFDLDQGLVTYMPATLVLGLAGLALVVLRPPAHGQRAHAVGMAVATVAIMAASTSTTNFNAGCAGMNRYDVWLAPLFAWQGARLFEGAAPALGRKWPRSGAATLAGIAAVALHLAILVRGDASDDAHVHGALAGLVLTHAPELYHPVPEIFAERTSGRSTEPFCRLPTPVAFFRPYGIATKVLVDGESFDDLRQAFDVDDAWFDAASRKYKSRKGLFYIEPPVGAVRARLADPPISYHDGWYDAEGLGDDRWRWMGKRASLVVRTLRATKGMLRLFGWVAAELPQDAVMTVRLDGRTVDRFMPPRRRFTREYPVDVPSNQVTVTLETSDAVTSSRDTRVLAFALLKAAIVPSRRTAEEQKLRFVGEAWREPFGDEETAPIRCMTHSADLHLETSPAPCKGPSCSASGFPPNGSGVLRA